MRASSDLEVHGLARADLRAFIESQPAVRDALSRFLGERRTAYAAAEAAAGLTAGDRSGP